MILAWEKLMEIYCVHRVISQANSVTASVGDIVEFWYHSFLHQPVDDLTALTSLAAVCGVLVVALVVVLAVTSVAQFAAEVRRVRLDCVEI
mmetsp:Transcript_22838/g.31969  ORF Transcript_22838/g.31969 Transcript_22838/m.31969 type:complete len:91 (+) Transcript_22838:821-1093(+)